MLEKGGPAAATNAMNNSQAAGSNAIDAVLKM